LGCTAGTALPSPIPFGPEPRVTSCVYFHDPGVRSKTWIANTVKGAADKVKGAIKDTAGKETGDKKLQSEGKFDKAKGSHNLAGDVKDAARDASKTADD
jgi:uncharacterized protein YjbJ (UPF0337 family)